MELHATKKKTLYVVRSALNATQSHQTTLNHIEHNTTNWVYMISGMKFSCLYLMRKQLSYLVYDECSYAERITRFLLVYDAGHLPILLSIDVHPAVHRQTAEVILGWSLRYVSWAEYCLQNKDYTVNQELLSAFFKLSQAPKLGHITKRLFCKDMMMMIDVLRPLLCTW